MSSANEPLCWSQGPRVEGRVISFWRPTEGRCRRAYNDFRITSFKLYFVDAFLSFRPTIRPLHRRVLPKSTLNTVPVNFVALSCFKQDMKRAIEWYNQIYLSTSSCIINGYFIRRFLSPIKLFADNLNNRKLTVIQFVYFIPRAGIFLGS